MNKQKAARLTECATGLLFRRTEDNRLKLAHANFCRVRLCPICAWRRSMKTHAHMMKILEAAKPKKLVYLMVTLTMRNTDGDGLSGALDKLISGFHNMVRRKRFGVWVGWYRGVEVTHNMAENTFHPHIHALVAVKPGYFKGKGYIKQEELCEEWKTALCVKYTPVCDVRRCYGISVKAVSEVAKYTTKSADIICFDDWDMTTETVRVLDEAFDGRRFIAYGGLFKELHKELNLGDEEDGDLIRVGDGDDVETVPDEILFWWHTGYGRYVK